jgi:hypothetical protein
LSELEDRFGGILPDLSHATELFVVSDYSGPSSERSSQFELFSFLVFAFHDAVEWESRRLKVRQSMGNRTMSFKGLHDNAKKRHLQAFLDAANCVPGLLVTMAVSKTHASLFGPEPLDVRDPALSALEHWKPSALEKALRVIHFLSFLLAGVSTEGQSFIWYTDEDEIAPNRDPSDRTRTRELGELWKTVLPNLVPFRVPQLVIGTKKDDEPSRSLTDLLAIPDLACGAWCRLLSFVSADDFINGRASVDEAMSTLPLHVVKLLSWFAEESASLRRMLWIIGEPLPGNQVEFMTSVPQALRQFRFKADALIDGRA